MAKKEDPEIFKCRTCGVITTEKGYLRKPREAERAYKCFLYPGSRKPRALPVDECASVWPGCRPTRA